MEVTIGEVCSSFVKTTRPFFRMVRRTSSVVNVEDVASKDISFVIENESDQQKLGSGSSANWARLLGNYHTVIIFETTARQ